MTQTNTPTSALLSLLIGPDVSLKEAVDRRRAQTLAAVSLVLAAALAGGMIFGLSRRAAPIAAMGVILASYALSRTRYANWGARLLVVGLLVSAILQILGITTMPVVGVNIVLLLMPVLLSMLLLNAQSTAIVAGLISLLTLIPIFFGRSIDGSASIAQFGAVTVLSIMATLTSFLRERDVTTIQKQSADLARYSQTLEAEARNMIATA